MEKKRLFSKQEMEDSDWLYQHYSEWMSKYPDKWVAVYRKMLIAIGQDAKAVETEAEKKFGKNCTPVVAFIEGGGYVY